MKRFYVLGHPVAHSKSPVMHNAAYSQLGLPWSYGLADCPTRDAAREFLASEDWSGLNVTMPFKPLAFESATWRSQAACAAHGANVLVRCGEELRAHNVDGVGCIAFLARCGVELAGARVVVCGTGPTSLAILHAALQAQAQRATLLGRSAEKACKVLATFESRCGQVPVAGVAQLVAGDYASCANDIAQADVIVDATPLGMTPGDPAPFDTSLLAAGQVVVDTVYGQGETALLAAARSAGCTAYDGLGMLVGQAVETVRVFAHWLNVPLDESSVDLFSVMAKAAGLADGRPI